MNQRIDSVHEVIRTKDECGRPPFVALPSFKKFKIRPSRSTSASQRWKLMIVALTQWSMSPYSDEYPNHDDALVITAHTANVYVKRIMVNTGSFANILYFDSFLKLGMTNWDLTPMTSTLTRFTRDAITLIGIATLQMTFGDEPRTKTLMDSTLFESYHLAQGLSIPSIFKRALSLAQGLSVLSISKWALSLAKGFQSRASPSEVSASPKCFQSRALPSEPLPLPKGFQSQASPGGLSPDHSPSELFTSPEDFPLVARWLHDNHVDFESIDSWVTQLYVSMQITPTLELRT
ncbi:hypothetical protein BHM03_00054841 [Ensete ventricosum]|nr:hypothetical protein BHM03_00054841 [Ensete ventricosum]